MGVSDNSVFLQLEQDELASPVARKELPDRTVYLSRPMPRTNGDPVLCDLGSARMDCADYEGDIMPDVYRAPEVIFGMRWSSKVDIWSVWVMVSLRQSIDMARSVFAYVKVDMGSLRESTPLQC